MNATIRYSIFVFCSVIFLWSAYAQDAVDLILPDTQDIEDTILCSDLSFELLGQQEVKSKEIYEYSLIWEEYDKYASGMVVQHDLYKWSEIIQTSTESNFSYEFIWSGAYTLQTSVSLDNKCVFALQKDIRSYDGIIVYVGKWKEELELAKNARSGSWSYDLIIKEIQIDGSNSSEKMYTELSEHVSYLRHADRVIIDTSSQAQVFESLWKLFTLNDIDTSSSQFFVIADVTQSYFRRLLARYITAAGIQRVFVLKDDYFWSLFTSLLLDKDPEQYDFIKSYSVSLENSNKRMFLSYMTDSLLFNWFPLGIISLVLILPFVALLISIARQVLWLSVFGVFTPLLFGISMFVIGITPSLMLLLSATLAVITIHWITRHIYLLYSPKISLMLILYCIFTILLRWWHNALWLNRVDLSSYSNNFAIFPFIAILIVAKWVFSDSFLQFKKWWIFTLLEFVLISFWVLYILNNDYFQNIFLWNPELILVVLVLNILVGRFTWLQVMEYFRFFPLIRNYFEEE